MDKFGRHSLKRGLPQKGPKGDGFHLTPEGDYDLRLKRMKNVGDPLDAEDAVNYNTLYKSCLTVGDVIDAKSKPITNVKNRTSYNDVDVPNKKYIKDNFVQYNYATSPDVPGNLNAKQNLVKNVLDPREAQDAATKSYVDLRTPGHGANHWNFFHKRLTNCSNPADLEDAVNLRFFQTNCPRINMVDGTYDVHKYRISSVGKPTSLNDAVNKAYLKEMLADLSHAMYIQFNKGKRRNNISIQDWKAKVMESPSTRDSVIWGELFNT